MISDGPAFRMFNQVPAFKIKVKRKASPWILTRHPLWLWTPPGDPNNALRQALEAAKADDGQEPLCWDTFNLERRPVQVREWIRETLRQR